MTAGRHQPPAADDDYALGPRDILEAVRDSSGALRGVLDQHYELTALMLQRRARDGTQQEILVEVIHEPRAADGREWMLVAMDQLHERLLGPVYGSSLVQVLAAVCWPRLESDLREAR